MKQQILFPLPLFLSALLACFLLGAIVGTIVTYVLIYKGMKSASIASENIKKELVLPDRAFVKEVVDGDTILAVVDQHELRIRYLGIDAPENKYNDRENFFAQEAYEKNKNLVEGKVIQLKWDKKFCEESPGRGFSGRLRAYVYIGETFVNAELLRYGFASVYRRQININGVLTKESLQHQHYEEFNLLEVEAQSHQRGIWNTKAREIWEKEQELIMQENPKIYIADTEYFHRPECPKVAAISFKRYHYQRDKAMKEAKPCPICKP